MIRRLIVNRLQAARSNCRANVTFRCRLAMRLFALVIATGTVAATADLHAQIRFADSEPEFVASPIVLTSQLSQPPGPPLTGFSPAPASAAAPQQIPSWPPASYPSTTWNMAASQYPYCVQDAPLSPVQNNQQGKTGTPLDSLPSFRGIKGIKNLPGGVGTLLMANPHAGATWYPTQSTDQPGTQLTIERNYFQAAVPIYHSGADTVVFTSHLDEMNVNTNAILPTTNQPFPSHLYNVAFGANYFHQYENGYVGGIVFDIGSASDIPFHSSGEMLASGTAFLLMPDGDRNAWFVGVNASTNNQVLYGLPIPGGGYFYNPSDDFQAIIGFPFSVVSWKPSPNWQLQYVYAFLTTMHARAVYQPTNNWQLYGGFDWTNENWRRVDRPASQDHFFYYEKRLAAGWLWWFRPNVGFELSGGWAFDRYFTEVDGFALVGSNTVRIGSGPFMSAQFDVRF